MSIEWPQRREIEFRDGVHYIPEYLARLLIKYDTTELTYDEAIQIANTGMLRSHVNGVSSKFIGEHFGRYR